MLASPRGPHSPVEAFAVSVLPSLHLSAGQQPLDSHIGRTGGSARSCPRPSAPRQHVPVALAAVWIGVDPEHDKRDAPKPSPCGEPIRCRRDDAKGSEVSPSGFRQDQFVQCQIRDGPAKALVLFLEPLQFLELFRTHSARHVWRENRPLDAFLNSPALQR